VVDILEHEESALQYEMDVEKRNRRDGRGEISRREMDVEKRNRRDGRREISRREMDAEKRNRRGMAACICLGLLVFILVVFVIPGIAVYLP